MKRTACALCCREIILDIWVVNKKVHYETFLKKGLLCVWKINVFSFNYTDTKVQQANINTTINTASKNNNIKISNNDNIILVIFCNK